MSATQFAFLAEPGTDQDSYFSLLERSMEEKGEDAQVRFAMTPVLGVAPFVAGVTPSVDVLRTLISASHDARAARRPVSIYSPKNDSAHQRRFRLLNDFASALEQPDQLRLVFQPRIDLVTGRCCGAEALLRWQHPVLGNVTPGEFIPIVEKTSLARAATAWVLNAGFPQLRTWRDSGIDIQLSVNVSAANLDESDFAAQVQLHLLKHRLKPGMIELEVTESAVMEDAGEALSQLKALNAAGIDIAIDDFGTGYSSLSYLQRLPAQVVKIDQSFVREVATCERERTLVRSMITLSTDLGYRVVAEGVETEAAAKVIAGMGCHEAQGYHFGRPMEAPEFESWFLTTAGSAALRVAV